MSIEDNKPNGMPGALKLPKGVLAGLSGVTSPDAPRDASARTVAQLQENTSADHAYLQTKDVSPATAGGEEAAVVLADASGFISPAAPTHHNMWHANNNEKADVLEMPPMLSGVAGAMDMIAQIEQDPALKSDPDIAQALQELKAYVDAAIKGSKNAKAPNLSDIATKISEAKADAAKADETPQAKVDRLWGEIDKLNKEASKRLDEHPLSDAQKAEHAQLEKAVEEAKTEQEKIEAQKKLILFYQKMGIQFNDPELLKIAEKMKTTVTEAQQAMKERDDNTKDATKQSASSTSVKLDTLASTTAEKDTKLTTVPASLNLAVADAPKGDVGAMASPPRPIAVAKSNISVGSDLG